MRACGSSSAAIQVASFCFQLFNLDKSSFEFVPTLRLLSMSSLADLPELVGFFSYSREDDADSQGALSALRYRI